MRFVYLVSVCLYWLIVPLAHAQQGLISRAGWKELTISDGLSQGMVYDLKQDQKGFIWVATKDGLNRYDGYNFTVYTPDTYNEYSLSDENCSSLLLDRHGRLWVGTLNQGLNLLDTKTERFYHLNIRDQFGTNAGNYEVRWIGEDPEGRLWVSTNKNQLFRITLPPELLTNYPTTANFTSQVQIKQMALPDKDWNGQVKLMQFQPDGQAILGTTYGMCRLNWRNPITISPMNRVVPPTSNFDSSSDASESGYWFSGTTVAIHGWYQGQYRKIPLVNTQGHPAKVMFMDKQTVVVFCKNLLWKMSPAELFRLDHLSEQNAYSQGAGNYYVTSLLKDRNGFIWLGTAGYGLRYYNPNVNLFHSYLGGHSLSYLWQDQQQRTYARQGYFYGQINFSTQTLNPWIDPSYGLNGLMQHFIIQDRKGNFWVVYNDYVWYNYHLIHFTKDWTLRKSIPIPSNVRFGEYVGTFVTEDDRGQIWIGAANGDLLRYDPVKGKMDVFSYAHLLPKGGAAIETYFLHYDKVGTLWICTNKGLIRASHLLQKPVFLVYNKSKTDRNSLSHDAVSCAVDDPYEPGRYLWVSTKGGGINKLEKATGQFTHITEAQGLPNKVVYGMLVDEFRNIWMSTNRGLAQFNPKTKYFHNYTKSDGLQDDEFNTGAFFKSASGELLFGGVNGLTLFRPSDFVGKSTEAPTAQIIGLSVNNERINVAKSEGILQEGIEFTQAIDLNHDQNILTLEFGLVDYRNPAQNRYRYRLEGINEQWVEAGTNRFANYTHLPDGSYTLQMMGSADGDVWSKPVVLQIRVHPPLYRTWWAYLFYLIVILVVAWQLYTFQTQRLLLQQQVAFEQKEASRLAELDALKTQFFTNISHEFRTPLTMILGPIEQAVEDYASDERFPMVQRNAQRLLRLINQLLDLAKLEAGQLQPVYKPGDMATFLRVLSSSFTSLAESRKLQFTFRQNQESRWAEFDRDKLEMIVTNLLSNAFKFTPAGKSVLMTVEYSTHPSEDMLNMTVQDTGIGIASDELTRIFDRFYQQSANATRSRYYEGTGIGLALVKELVDVLGGSVTVDSTEGVGTTFRVALPLRAVEATEAGLQSWSWGTQTTVENAPLTWERATPLSIFQGERPGVRFNETNSDNLLLIVDDNPDIRAYIRSIFTNDYQILEAADGQYGLEVATESIPNLVICDLMMPRLDGFGFCRALKTQTATSHIPVVMLTARATIEDRIEGFGLGADEYLTKPFNQAEIRVRVRNLLEKQARLQHYFSDSSPTETRAAPAVIASKEEQFIDHLHQIIDANSTSSKFGVLQLSEGVNMSQSQLVRKLKALTNQTGVEFIRNRRLELAAQRLRQGESVSDVGYQVGFESLSYFARSFQEKYGVLPSDYQRL